ncbi:MAG TPA: hypothetical protein VGU69_10585 [Rhizomicrobium sp.]|nr:hypothetical protein [Rhizomicrobium sp.]
MSRTVRRRKINWGATARRQVVPICPPVEIEPPEFLGTWSWRYQAQGESIEDWIARTGRQRAELAAQAANWLRKQQPVRVLQDPRLEGPELAGRVGTILRPCSSVFADHVYVLFRPIGRQRVDRIRMIALDHIEPVD